MCYNLHDVSIHNINTPENLITKCKINCNENKNVKEYECLLLTSYYNTKLNPNKLVNKKVMNQIVGKCHRNLGMNTDQAL